MKKISLSLTDIRFLEKDRSQLIQYKAKSVVDQFNLIEKAK